MGFKGKEEIAPLRNNFNQAVSQILNRELPKKRGELMAPRTKGRDGMAIVVRDTINCAIGFALI